MRSTTSLADTAPDGVFQRLSSSSRWWYRWEEFLFVLGHSNCTTVAKANADKARESIHDEILSESLLDQIVDDLYLERLQTSMLYLEISASRS